MSKINLIIENTPHDILTAKINPKNFSKNHLHKFTNSNLIIARVSLVDKIFLFNSFSNFRVTFLRFISRIYQF